MAAEEGSEIPLAANDDEDCPTDRKLWVGNLDKRLSEYNILKILQRFGEIEKFEFLFHGNGPSRGEPRGYCFVEYKLKEDAVKALQGLNGKIALSRPLMVDWAHHHKYTPRETSQKNNLKKREEETKLHKTKTVSKDSKIKAIEAKLRLMESTGSSNHTQLGWNKHPLLVESERNKSHPYKTSRSGSKSEWKGKKPR